MQFSQFHTINAEVAHYISELTSKLEALSAPLAKEEIYPQLSKPPKAQMGDLAFPCFQLAKSLKMAPPQIANQLLEISKQDNDQRFSEIKAFGPYINLYLDENYLNQTVLKPILDKSLFSKKLCESAPKTMIEYSQPNTHKVLHVGHMRNLCLGQSIVNIFKYAGVETLSTTFPGDVGTHVAKCLWYYVNHNQETPPTDRKGAWLGELYSKGNNLLEEQRGTDKEESNRKELTQILKELHAGKGKYFDLWKETRAWSIELMQDVYKWADAQFDSWYWESDVDAESVELVKKYFEQGLFVKDQGAVGIDLSDDKLGFCLLLKSDGTGLYATKDLELARRKFEDQKVELSLYVVDNRQALHFKQVFKTLEKMGFKNAKNCHHLQYEMVELSDGAMSSRKGNIIPIQSLIDQMVLKIKNDYLSKYAKQWSEEEINLVANQVASGAIKYGMNSVDSQKKIVFSMEDWLKLDGESGPYIQYVHARIHSMLEKVEASSTKDYSLLEHELEKALILHLGSFNLIIQQCLTQYKTHFLANYLYDLARKFNSFYAQCSVLNAENEDLKNARADLAKATAMTIEKGLNLLGIQAPKKM